MRVRFWDKRTNKRKTGDKGERLVMAQLRKRGFKPRLVRKMGHDIVLRSGIKIEVRTCGPRKDGAWAFSLASNPYRHPRRRIPLGGGKREVFHKRCDFFILCCLSKPRVYFVIPRQDIPLDQVGLGMGQEHPSDYKGKWSKYRERWDLLG
jgi:hypothetical protein